MIQFPRFGEYSSQSKSYKITSRVRGSISTEQSVPWRCETVKSKKSKKSILMDLLRTEDYDVSLLSQDDDYAYINGTQPKLVIPWKQLMRSDPNYDLHTEQFPSPGYVGKYMQKLGFKMAGEDILPPYDFGYYAVKRRRFASDHHMRKKRKRILSYGARCGHCSRFIRIRNGSAEGGFLSYIDYFKHWINYHCDKT